MVYGFRFDGCYVRFHGKCAFIKTTSDDVLARSVGTRGLVRPGKMFPRGETLQKFRIQLTTLINILQLCVFSTCRFVSPIFPSLFEQ